MCEWLAHVHLPPYSESMLLCCSWPHVGPGRKHHLWDCPVAAAVVAELCILQHRRHRPPVHHTLNTTRSTIVHIHELVRRLHQPHMMALQLSNYHTPLGRTSWALILALGWQHNPEVCTWWLLRVHWLIFGTYCMNLPWVLNSLAHIWRRLLPRDMPFLHFPHVARRLQLNNVHRLPVV
jgi:hypothetical protein